MTRAASAVPPLSLHRLSASGLAKFRKEFTSWNRSLARVEAQTYTVEDFADPAFFKIRGEHDESLETRWVYRGDASEYAREYVREFDVGASFARRASICEEMYALHHSEDWPGTTRGVVAIGVELVLARHRTTLATDWTLDEAAAFWARLEEFADESIMVPLDEIVACYLCPGVYPFKREPRLVPSNGGAR